MKLRGDLAMDDLYMRGTKHMRLTIEDPERLCEVSRALSNPLRLQILLLLGKKSMQSVNDRCLGHTNPGGGRADLYRKRTRHTRDAEVIHPQDRFAEHGSFAL